MKKIVWLCCFAMSSTLVHSQNRLQFRSQNYVGLLEGNDQSAFQLTTINGIQQGAWFLGAGTGLDWYRYRTIPLFFSVNKDLKLARRGFFFSADAGTNFVWNKNQTDLINGYAVDYKPGYYWGAGFGYKALFRNKKDAIIINMGYNVKQVKETQEITIYCLVPPCPAQIERYNYRLRRFSFRLGWQF